MKFHRIIKKTRNGIKYYIPNVNDIKYCIKNRVQKIKQTQIVHKYSNHGTLIELIWTISPALVLVAIAFPSFKLLYLMDEVTNLSLTVFVEGH